MCVIVAVALVGKFIVKEARALLIFTKFARVEVMWSEAPESIIHSVDSGAVVLALLTIP